MKILFVCRGNVGRSQISKALFNKYSKWKSESAGTIVFENENQKLKSISLADPVIRFMKKEGIDVSENVRMQLKPEDVTKYDKIILMAERDTIPEYLLKNNKVEFWNIKDPKGLSDKEYELIIAQLKEKVLELINKTNSKR